MRFKIEFTLIMLIITLICYSCNSDEDTSNVDIKEYFQHIDTCSEFIILIPDIQNYISNTENLKYLEKIIDWVIQFDKAGYKVKAVLQLGDVTNFNSRKEWERAQRLFAKLDDKINYTLCTGNHDYGDDGACNNRKSYFSEYFNFKSNSSFITSFEKDNYENTYFEFDIHGNPFQLFSLEFGPRDKVISWADSIAKANYSRIGIVMTHAYLHEDKQRFNFALKRKSQTNSPHNYAYSEFGIERVNDGEEIWTKLINENNNLRFVLCGHKTVPDYIGSLVSLNQEQNEVFQLLYNTQEFSNGGDGWIQIFEFLNDGCNVKIKAFSTAYNIWEADTINNQFIFKYK